MSTPATEVDHVAEIQDGGDEFDEANCLSTCSECHLEKTKLWRAIRRRVKEVGVGEDILDDPDARLIRKVECNELSSREQAGLETAKDEANQEGIMFLSKPFSYHSSADSRIFFEKQILTRVSYFATAFAIGVLRFTR